MLIFLNLTLYFNDLKININLPNKKNPNFGRIKHPFLNDLNIMSKILMTYGMLNLKK